MLLKAKILTFNLFILLMLNTACTANQTTEPRTDVAITGHSEKSGVFNPTTFTLDNGMDVVLVENHRLPIVSHMVWYRVGAIDEPATKSGLAHFLEHLMFKGTDKIDEGEFSKIVARHGGEDNAFTSWDYTAYYQKIAVDHLPKMMEMEADRMTGLKLSKNAFETEKKVIIEERRSVIENNPIRQFGEQLNAALYLNHPYQIPVIGWAHEIEALTYDDVLNFYKKYYHPGNAILVVSGDVTPDQLKKLAKKTYGKVKARPVPTLAERPAFTEPPHLAVKNVVMHKDGVQLPLWQREYLAPKYGDGDAAYALQIASQILGGGQTGRLYQRLVVDEKIATGASTWYDPSRRGPGMFALNITAVDAKPETLVKIEQLVEEELQKLQTTPPTEAEFDRAVSSIVAASVYARDGIIQPAMAMGQIVTIGLDVSYVEGWPTNIKAVTPEQVMQALQGLDGNAAVTGQLLPKVAEKQ